MKPQECFLLYIKFIFIDGLIAKYSKLIKLIISQVDTVGFLKSVLVLVVALEYETGGSLMLRCSCT